MVSATSTTKTAGNGPEDLLLVQSALRGEDAAIDALMGRLGCVPRFVFRLNGTLGCGLATEALEDVVQQVYTALWQRLADFHGRNPLETWVFGFCRNCLRSAVWRRRSTVARAALSDELLAATPAAGDSPASLLDRSEALGALHQELDQLPDEERAVVIARHLDGRGFEEIARATGVAVSTIKDRCYRAMQRLKQKLGRRMVGG